MKKDIEYFSKLFVKQIQSNKHFVNSNIGYGEDVMPILEVYGSTSIFEERKAFKDALANFLSDPDPIKRNFAIDICLGFFVFRDAVGHK
jgi:hypothetical protein